MSYQPHRRAHGGANSPSLSGITKSFVPPKSASSASSPNSYLHRLSSMPTKLELLLLLLFPFLLLLGSTFSTFSPLTNSTPYSTATQSHPPELAPSYFARKSNILNIYFVKVLWAWVTLAFVFFTTLHPLTGTWSDKEGSRRKVQAFLRFAAITIWWAIVTQWFFGPAIIDRGFRLSGGRCERLEAGELETKNLAEEVATAAACKTAGGTWRGGYDISGHVFILALGSAFLVFEAAPVLEMYLFGQSTKDEEGKTIMRGGEDREWGWTMGVLSTIVSLCLWMLLMTAVYFHTWVEKFSGLLVALFGLGAVYFLPRAVPTLRGVLGRPGI